MDLVFVEGRSRKYWGAALSGRTLHTAWGRLGGTLQTKAARLASPAAARAAYEALVAGKRKKGYVDARPRPGSRTFLAADHEHADVVHVDVDALVACSLCDMPVERVRVGAAPPRPEPRPATKNTHALRLGPLPAPQLQADALWPLAAALPEGKVLTADELIERVRRGFVQSTRGRRAVAALARTAKPVWRAKVKKGKATDPSRVGGAPAFLEPVAWPRCRSCKEDLVFVAQLAAGPGTPIPLRKKGRIFLFECEEHCWVAGGQGVIIQPATAAKAARPVPHKRSSTVLPMLALDFVEGVETLGEESDDEAAADDPTAIERALVRPPADARVKHGTKLGGHPDWIQSALRPKCRTCKEPLAFVAQICAFMHPSTLEHPLFGDAGRFYLFVCPAHETSFLEFQCS